MRQLILFMVLLSLACPAWADEGAPEIAKDPSRTVKGIEAEGSCAIPGMTEEQAYVVALRRARASAIEQAMGKKSEADARVTDCGLQTGFMAEYSKGYIIKEKVWRLHPTEYKKDEASAPVPEYKVKIMANVMVPRRLVKPIGLDARLNSPTFRSGERAEITVDVKRDVKIAVFRVTADDMVVMIFPGSEKDYNIIYSGLSFIFPSKDGDADMTARTLPEHREDAEAVFVAVMDESHEGNFTGIFKPFEPMEFSAFFKRYSEVSEFCEEAVLPYKVVGH
jgi:hypothetical protein